MTTPSNEQSLDGLLERVKAATGPDSRLNVELATLSGWKWNVMHGSLGYWTDPEGDQRGIPDYTSSIDAALALVGRLLPEHDWILGHTNGGLTIHCQLGPDADKMAFGENPALAILAALLTALKDASE